MNKVILLFLVLVACFSKSILQHYQQFRNYQLEYHKRYPSKAVQIYRWFIFVGNLNVIDKLNEEDEATGVYGLTRFTDLTKDEMIDLAGLKIPKHIQFKFSKNYTNQKTYIPKTNTPDIWNWVQQGAVTEIKDQGTCGSCWTFSTAGNIEGLHFLKTKQLIDFSQQQLIDCDKSNFGCNGGWPYMAFDWLSQNGGIMTYKDYPLRANYSGPCKFNRTQAKVQIKGYLNITRNQTIIKDALYQLGPLSILLDFEGMFHYKSGIASPLYCYTWPNHALILVGYGTQGGDYWLIKNSWGPKWGLDGYLMLKRGVNKCGVGYWATTGVLDE